MQYKEQSDSLKGLKAAFYSSQLPSFIKTLRELDEDLSQAINSHLKCLAEEQSSVSLLAQNYFKRAAPIEESSNHSSMQGYAGT